MGQFVLFAHFVPQSPLMWKVQLFQNLFSRVKQVLLMLSVLFCQTNLQIWNLFNQCVSRKEVKQQLKYTPVSWKMF